MPKYWDWPEPKQCHECGKDIYIYCRLQDYAYKRPQGSETDYDTKYFCSWHCLRAYDRRMGEE